MRILVFHGYLLGGTGSNVYNARLAKALVRLGHEVHLLCQERHPERAGFVDAAGDWEGGRLALRPLRHGRARCTVYRPNIGDLLPVYVHDRYEGVEARTFALCGEEELERYIAANVEAVEEVARLAQPDIALANHLVMGPVILARALAGKVRYAVKVHGSALEYTVKADPQRFLPFAWEGIAAASGVLVGSRHTAESLWQALGMQWTQEHDLLSRTRLGPPGVDIHAFAPRDPEAARIGLKSLAGRLAATEGFAIGQASTASAIGQASTASAIGQADAFARDDRHAAAALAELDRGSGPIVVYVGKLIVSKGVDLLLAAWPLVLQRSPEARLAIVGFGALRQRLEAVWAGVAAGSLHELEELALEGRALEGGPRAPLGHLQAFLGTLGHGLASKRYLSAAAAAADSVIFTGRLDHEELGELLPACEAIVMPSTFPEAFGMVAVEGAACGLLPISAGHSGLAEVSGRLAAAVPEQVGSWLSFPVDDEAVHAIARRLSSWLGAPAELRATARAGIVAAVRRRWSWEGVSEGVIAAAKGRVEDLPRP